MLKKIVKAVIGFIYKKPAAVSGKSSFIAGKLTLNSDIFAGLDPSIEDGVKIINDLATAVTNYDGSSEKGKLMKEAVVPVQALMRKWGPQVTIIADGSDIVLGKSGFDNYKEKESTPDVYTPAAVIVKDTINSGKVTIRVPAVRYSDKYQYRYSIKDNPTEEEIVTLEPGKRVLTIDELTPVTIYHFSARVFGKNGSISDWNEFIAYPVR